VSTADRRQPAARLAGVEISGIREILETLTAWSHPERKSIPFHLGMPDFDTPLHIKQALYDAVAAGFVRYTASKGTPDLLAAFARKLERENRIKVDPGRQLVATCGANEAISVAIMALVDPGDEVILPDPAWPHYEYCLRLAGAVPVRCSLREEDGFALKPEAVASVWTDRTRMVVINSPHNPTGAVMPPADIEAIARLARERGAWLLSDEAYERILYEGEHLSPASLPGMDDTVLTVGCLSKTYAMTGWRIGFLSGPERAIDAANKVHLYTVSCATSFVQKAAIAALDGSQEPVAQMVSEYRRRREIVVGLLREIPGLSVQRPPGAFYVFPNVKSFGLPSKVLAMRLVQEAGVGAVHGSAFGPAGEGFLRISYCCSEEQIREGVARMKQLLASIPVVH
jgi:aspartate/methionine/tyrosine aminotransferase